MTVVLHGPAYSTYTRTARMALAEKGVAYELREVNLLGGEGQAPGHLARQPWGKVPAFEHDGFALFETFAICRYVDEAFPGPALQPADVRARARMTQICSVIDSYGYGPMVGKVFWQVAIIPMQGGQPDERVIAEGLAQAEKALGVIEGLMASDGTLCGGGISLADLHLVPVLDYFAMTPQGQGLLAKLPKLGAWRAAMAARKSVVETQPKLG
jgi:glutathione S-transferase